MVCCALTTFAQKNHNFETAKQMNLFNQIYRELDLFYVDTLDAEKRVGDAINYMLSDLDPYTEFYKEENTDNLKTLTTGKYAGIGSPIVYRADFKRAVFSTPYPGMPAAEAGLRSGDRIIAIDGKEVPEYNGPAREASEKYLNDITSKLRGEPSTTVEVRIQRPGREKPLNFKIVRRQIVRNSVVLSKMLNDSVGYIFLESFTEDSYRDVRNALAQLKTRGLKKLVFDLRDNGGGLLDQAVDIVNLFIPSGKEVVSTRGKDKKMESTYKTKKEPFDTEMPLVILVNGGTASASEITSGGLQDYDRAVIVGQRTYGKGLVQSPRNLSYNTILKLTTGKYYTPSGRCIQAYKFKNGEPQHLPDSLSKEFKTMGGRIVRDSGGIMPDVTVTPDTLPGFVSYLGISNQLFDWTVDYRAKHPTIAAAKDFKLTDGDINDLKEYLKTHKFEYGSFTKKQLQILRDLAKAEGYDQRAEAEFKALEEKLEYNLDYTFERWDYDIRRAAELMVVGEYYGDKGMAEYNLRKDKELMEALQILSDNEKYRSILK